LRGYSVHPDLPDYKSMLRRITKASNEVLFEVVEDLVHSFVEDRASRYSKHALQEQCRSFVAELLQNAVLSFSSANVSSCRNLVKEPQLVS
jgi:hypothetical protein